MADPNRPLIETLHTPTIIEPAEREHGRPLIWILRCNLAVVWELSVWKLFTVVWGIVWKLPGSCLGAACLEVGWSCLGICLEAVWELSVWKLSAVVWALSV